MSVGTAWTDERVEMLKSLWADGLSASQIAAELGGVSRNAVIGKVHRLGLSGRKVKVKAPRSSASARPVRKSAASAAKSGSALARAVRGNLAYARDPSEDPEEMTAADIVPLSRYLTLMELDASTCRWPIGDPQSSDFRFCGAPTEAGEVYCAPCSRRAYQPKGDRSRNPPRPRETGRLTRFR